MPIDIPKIGFLHAVEASVHPADRALLPYSDIFQPVHYVKSGILGKVENDGSVDAYSMLRFQRAVETLYCQDVSALVVVCTICGRLIPRLTAQSPFPIMAADGPLLAAAAAHGGKIAAVGSNPSCANVCKNGIVSLSPGAWVKPVTVSKPWEPELSAGYDLIVLSQFTIAHWKDALQKMGVSVLTAPETLAAYLTKEYEKKEDKIDSKI